MAPVLWRTIWQCRDLCFIHYTIKIFCGFPIFNFRPKFASILVGVVCQQQKTSSFLAKDQPRAKLSHYLAFFCFLSLNVMPSTLPLPPCSGRWYPPAEDFKIWFRILKCGFKRKQLGFWNSLRPSPPPAPLHHPLLTPMLFVLQRIFRLVEIFVS